METSDIVYAIRNLTDAVLINAAATVYACSVDSRQEPELESLIERMRGYADGRPGK